MDWLAALFNTVAQKDPEARFEVVTRDDAETVRAALDIRRQARRSAFDLSERIRERARGAAKAVHVRDVFHVRDKSSLGVRRPASGKHWAAASRWWPMRELGMWRILSAGTMSG